MGNSPTTLWSLAVPIVSASRVCVFTRPLADCAKALGFKAQGAHCRAHSATALCIVDRPLRNSCAVRNFEAHLKRTDLVSRSCWSGTIWLHVVVSWNRGTPSHDPFLDGIFPNKNQLFWGYPHLWKPPYDSIWLCSRTSSHTEAMACTKDGLVGRAAAAAPLWIFGSSPAVRRPSRWILWGSRISYNPNMVGYYTT